MSTEALRTPSSLIFSFACPNLRKDGTRLTVLLATTSLRNDLGDIDGYLGVATDITERTRAVARIRRMAHYDHLPRLPNRRLFHDRMQVAIAQARREKTRLALMLIDLDNFKPINDTFGHAVGDLVTFLAQEVVAKHLLKEDTQFFPLLRKALNHPPADSFIETSGN